MNGKDLRKNRKEANWTQNRLASRLGVSQAYLSFMERGKRPVPDHLAREVTRVLQLPATGLPYSADSLFDEPANEPWVEQALARLGYPGFAYRRKPGVTHNPMELLLKSLACDDLDPRLTEALPWLLLNFDSFDHASLVKHAKLVDLQNRLGFTVKLACQVAEKNPRWGHRAKPLHQLVELLEPSRLARVDTFGRTELSERMRHWLLEHRSKSAEHWNLLTDLKPEHLPYAS